MLEAHIIAIVGIFVIGFIGMEGAYRIGVYHGRLIERMRRREGHD